MSYAAGLFGGLNDRRREETQASRAEEDRLSGLESNLLMQLAQGDDPEIAQLAGAGLLEILAGNGKVQKAKGLRGFLGEVSRSSYLPGIKSVLEARRAGTPQTPGTPGGGALPPGSPVEPKAQGAEASLPPMPSEAYGGLRRFQADFGQPSAASALPSLSSAAAGGAPGGAVPPGPPALGAFGSPALPAPPEAPAQKSARLFPSAAETAQRAKEGELMARYNAALAALQQAEGNPMATRMIMGINGTPLPQLRPTAVNVDFINPATGLQESSVGVMTEDGAVEVNGVGVVRPIGDVRPITQRPGAPIKTKRQRQNPDGTPSGVYDDVIIDPQTGEEQVIPSGMPVVTPPTLVGGNIDLGGGRIGRTDRAGNVVPVGRENPPQPSTRTPSATTTEGAREAKALYATLQTRVKEKLSTMRDDFGQPLKALPIAQLNALTKEVTQGKYPTFEALQRGVQGLGAPAAPAGGPPAFGSPEGANAIDAALAARRGQRR